MARKSKEQLAAEAAERDAMIKEKVDAGVKAALEGMMPAIVAKIEAAGGQPATGADTSWAMTLATSLAELTNQNTGRPVPVSPEIMNERRVQREKMIDLLVMYREQNVPLLWTVRKACFFAERIIEPQWQHPTSKEMMDTKVEWPNIPNENLEPDNEAARAVMDAYMGSIGNAPAGMPHQGFQSFVHGNKGLIVKARPFGENGTSEAEAPNGLRIASAGGGRTKEVHVLGSVHAPIRVGA